MKLGKLKKLAEAATPAIHCGRDEDYLNALSPKRILALIRVVEAADAMRLTVDAGDAIREHRNKLHAFDAAREELEKL